MNEIVNIIDRRAGVGRPVRTGKQKQAERGARRERRGVLYAAGVGSRSSPFYHPKSLDSIFFFFISFFLFFLSHAFRHVFRYISLVLFMRQSLQINPSTRDILVTRFSSYIFLFFFHIYERRGILKHDIVHELFIYQQKYDFNTRSN